MLRQPHLGQDTQQSAGPDSTVGTEVAETPAVPSLDTGDTAWMMVASALVLMMSIPGLALFYAGMVRKKNVLSVLMQVFATICVLTAGLDDRRLQPRVHERQRLCRRPEQDIPRPESATRIDFSGTIPETVFMMFQMTFVMITPALIVGAFVDRMKFSAMLLFMILWSVIVYAPIAHWVWASTGFLFRPACSTSPAARWCTSTPALPGWSAASCWASGSATARSRWRPTTWC